MLLKFLDFRSDNLTMLFPQLFSASCFVVKHTVVFVCVAMEGTEQLSTAASNPAEGRGSLFHQGIPHLFWSGPTRLCDHTSPCNHKGQYDHTGQFDHIGRSDHIGQSVYCGMETQYNL